MDEAVDWFRQMCLQKNVTIGQFHIGQYRMGEFHIESNDDSEKLMEKLVRVLDKTEMPLKIKSMNCAGAQSGDLMWKVMEYCDKSLLTEMGVEMIKEDEVFELFGKQDEIVKNLEKIEIECLCNVSDEDLLSLNTSVISLKSENFTDDLVYKLIEKFRNRREDGSAFCIENSQKQNLGLKMIPPGFEETNSTNGYKEYRNELIDTNHPTVYLRVSDDRVRLQIGVTKKANFWYEVEYNHDTSDGSDSTPDWGSDYDAFEDDFDPDDAYDLSYPPMTKKSIELCDLPLEMLQLLVEKCDFVTRRRLRASSSLMYQVVNSTKLYIPIVKMTLWNEKSVFVDVTVEPFKVGYNLEFENNQTGGTLIWINSRNSVEIENSTPLNEAVDWFRQMCLQKNVTIGQFHVEDSKILTEKLEAILGKSEIPLKIKSIFCLGTTSGDSMWKVMDYCDKRLLREMKVRTMNADEIFELFGKQNEIVKHLEKIEIECLCNVSVEDVLSLNASVISLKSENFTDDLVYKLIEKFTNRREDGSAFCIENSQKRNLDLKTIPPGFKETDSTNRFKEYRNQLINTNLPTVYLRVNEGRVRLQIGDSKKATFWIEDESDSDTSDDSGSIPDWDMGYDVYEDDFDQNYDEYENAFDQDYDYFDDDFFWD